MTTVTFQPSVYWWVFNFGMDRITWGTRLKQQPTLVFLPGQSLGQRSLAGYSPWDHKTVRHDLATKLGPTVEGWAFACLEWGLGIRTEQDA